MSNQIVIFIIFILDGFLIGILFDIFRILRKSFNTPDFITYLQDIAFWILTGLLLIYSIFKFNNGELRVFIFLGIAIGILLYMLIFSKIFINVSVYIIKLVKLFFNRVILIPLKFILNVLNKSIVKPTINLIKNILSFTEKKTKKSLNKKKNMKIKKDFA